MRVDPIPALKQQLGAELARLVAGWNADDIAVVIGTDRPRISELRRGKLARFSLETLIRYLARLRCRVDVTVTQVPIARAHVALERGSRRPPAE
jgi:predicted XRE-type DNA-binding protein